jgi:hypothetical protein
MTAVSVLYTETGVTANLRNVDEFPEKTICRNSSFCRICAMTADLQLAYCLEYYYEHLLSGLPIKCMICSVNKDLVRSSSCATCQHVVIRWQIAMMPRSFAKFIITARTRAFSINLSLHFGRKV